MDTYIVRIYRYDHAKPRALVGTVEVADGDGKMAFLNMEELWNILNPMNRMPLNAPATKEEQVKFDRS